MPESCHSESTWKFKNRMFFSIEGKEVFLFSLKSTFCSVVQSCLTLGNPMDCSTPGFPVLHHLPEFVEEKAFTNPLVNLPACKYSVGITAP